MHVNFIEPHYPYQGRSRKKMMLIIFFCLLFGVLLAGATWFGAQMFAKNNVNPTIDKIEQIDTRSFVGKVKSLFIATTRPALGLRSDRINIAVLGIGGEAHEGGLLTDTILVANIKPSTKQVALISIPRDTVVKVPGLGYRKINEAHALSEMQDRGSGPDVAVETLENFLGISIPYYIRVDFRGFEQMIDDIGGVDVYVDKPFTDAQCPTWDFKVQTISFAKGWQHLNGVRALQYARSRHGNNFEGSDFARSRRQQKLMVAVRDKLLSKETLLHPSRVTDILRTLDTHINTNLDIPEFLELAQLGKEIDADKIESIVFSDDPASVLYPDVSEGAFYLRPRDPTLGQIHTLIKNIFDADVIAAAKSVIDQMPLKPVDMTDIKIEVQNGTWRPGFAARQKKILERNGYRVSAIGNAALRPITNAQIFSVTHKNQAIFDKVKKLYNAEEIVNRPPVSPDSTEQMPAQVDIILILGENNPDIAE
ncbi:MAG: hypothetical protein A2848_01105 [Candidatus Magasanikbacteria bacterium RIFCSPHIGHO2_01_FULL_50_8]|uniref:Cell envelope-related transcriptional attenuator domain-containing protein n=1 Tax=Candidatus Magasanikbacteria bacterium RIFCSPHIGHO2_01_FULL_50_8 TaxID=1798674 RepID=A0A1F6LQX4_9BACT|nr:MAG: hypothetical protein A2848_01105 [Candidatus Magasanikbacteria bacterium RIFCSPHIGHO2_01_FULL_50_8]